MRQMYRKHQDVWYALVAFVLEVVFGEPERVEPQRIHLLRDGLRLFEQGGSLFIRVTLLVGGRQVLPHVGEINMAGIDGYELGDHFIPPVSLRARFRSQFATSRRTARGLIPCHDKLGCWSHVAGT